MHCTDCGAQLEDDASFCPSCGKPVTRQATTEASKSKSLTIPIVIAGAIIVVLAIAVIGILIFQGESEEKVTSQVSVSASAQNDEASAKPTLENSLFRISLPSDLADKVSFKEEGDVLTVYYEPEHVFLVEMNPQSAASEYDIEYAHDTYKLGNVFVSGTSEPAFSMFNIVNSENKSVHAAMVDSSCEIGVDKLLGMTCEEFIACIELKSSTGFAPATPSFEGGMSARLPTGDQQNATSGIPTSAFWGIWANASKSKSEMNAEAQRIRNDYGLDAFVVLTTDWSNLNSEPWYCISLGSFSSESEANAALSKARQVDSSAYVKYSGSRK